MPNVIEIEQKDLAFSLGKLNANYYGFFTRDHTKMYNYMRNYAGENPMEHGKGVRFLVAKNEQNKVVGIGIANFVDEEEKKSADLEILMSVQQGAGKAIVEAIIDYSRQMENRTDLSLLVENEGLKPYYVKFGFAQNLRDPEGMVQRKSQMFFNPDIEITKFEPLPATERKVEESRRGARAMGF